MNDTNRAEFEAAFGGDCYTITEKKIAWEAWQEARAEPERVALSDAKIIAIAVNHYGTQATAQELSFARAIISAQADMPTQSTDAENASKSGPEIDTLVCAYCGSHPPLTQPLIAEAARDDAQELIAQLHAAMRSVNAVAIERGDKYGACDQIDNDGVPYQSQWLADLLADTSATSIDSVKREDEWSRAEQIRSLSAELIDRDATIARLMDDVSDLCQGIYSKFTNRLAIMLECMLIDPNGSWNESASLLDDYRTAWDAINPPPPTFMGEPMPPDRKLRLMLELERRAARRGAQ